jgi:hypothetical protein
MKIKFITYASNSNHNGWVNLEKSLKHFGWDYKLIVSPWKGFGTKLLGVYDHIKNGAEDDLDILIFGDSYDTFMLCSPDEVIEKYKNHIDKVLFSAELDCWPDKGLIEKYPACNSPYRFLNGGGFICTVENYINLIDMDPCDHSVNDQERHTDLFLNRNAESKIILDNNCSIFQTLGHTKESDFEYKNRRVINKITGESPCLIHGNGNTPLIKAYELLNL